MGRTTLVAMIKKQGLNILLGLVSTGIIGFFLIRTVSEYDIWFHLAMGKEILRTGSIPVVDRFSLLNMGRPYHDSQWLFQVLVAAGYRFAGFWWLQAVQVALWGVTLSYVFRACRVWSTTAASWLFVLVTALACEERFTVRPELVTVAILAMFYFWLQQGKYRSLPGIGLFALMQIVWTNSHGVYVIGPFLVGCYLLEALYQGWIDKKYADVRHLGILLCVVLAGCLVTPYGLGGLKFAWLLLLQVSPAAPRLFEMVYDLAPPLGSISRGTTAFWFFFALLAAGGVTVSAMLWCRRGRVPLARTLIAAGMLAAAMTGIRNMPLFAVVVAPLIAEYWSLLPKPLYRKFCLVATGTVLAVAMLVWSPRPALEHLTTWVPYRFGIGLSPDYVPLALPRLLDRLKFTGPVFNSQNLGGFYEFHGYPERIPFFDGRFEAYKPEVLLATYRAAANATTQPEAWNELMRRYDFRGVLLENGSVDAAGLLPTLVKSPQWRLVYLDCAASFWLRTDYPGLPPEVDAAAVASLVENIDSFANAQTVFEFLDAASLYPDLRLKLLEQASRRWEDPFILKNLGLLQMQSGMPERAEETFRRLLKLTPRSPSTIVTLAQLALMRGDRTGAENYLLRGLKYYPDDAVMKENLEIVRTPIRAR